MYTNRTRKIRELEDVLDRDVYVLCHNRRADAYIDGTMIDVLRKMIDFTKRRERAALIIQTPGGDLAESYYIGEFFREYYDNTASYIVSDCYSGGTLIALSTNEIYLSRSGCLGPIDIQRQRGNSRENWYPALSGQVEALKKANEEGEIGEFLLKSFDKKMDVLATYFKEKYTYRDLIGKNIKNHCEADKFEEIWNYLSALNIEHSIPMTLNKLNELGLDVKEMDESTKNLIQSIIRDIENEFGGLRTKSPLYDFYKNTDSAIIKAKDYGVIKNEGIDKYDYMDGEKIEYSVSTVNEKLAVIETCICGYMQNQELGATLANGLPCTLTVVSSGWDEEVDTTLTADEEENLGALLERFTMIAIEQEGMNIEEMSPEEIATASTNVYAQIYQDAQESIKNSGYNLEDFTASQQYQMVVSFIINNSKIIEFGEEIENALGKYVSSLGIDYSTITALEKLDYYDELMMLVCQLMVDDGYILETDIEDMDDNTIEDMTFEYIREYDLEFE